MSGLEWGLVSFPVLLALIFARVPIGLAMLICGAVGSRLVLGRWGPVLSQLKSTPFDTFTGYSLSIVPLFLLMGQFATRGGMSGALFRAAAVWLGHRRGGVPMAAIGACAGFGAICGSSLATAATMGRVALPELRAQGFSGALSAGTLAAGGTLGILIPPSVILVVYAVLTEQNIASLFLAALVPGLLAVAGYMLTIAVLARVGEGAARVRARASAAERREATLAVWPVLLVFAVVIGGIYAGVFTPTEAAAIGAFGTGAIALANGGLKGGGLMDAFRETASTTAMIFLIVLGAAVYNGFLAFTRLPQEAALWIGAQGLAPTLVLVSILATYLVLGCIMDSLSMILLTVPIFFPIVSALDFGLAPDEFALWFGVLVLVVVETGLITPPVGLNLFVINALPGGARIPMGEVYRGALPFVASDLVRIAILLAFPAITLELVRLTG